MAKVNTFGIPSKLKLSLGKRGRPDLQKINRPKTNQGANEFFNKGGNTMNSKKKAKRYNGEDGSMVDQDLADSEATEIMKRNMAEGDRDEKALSASYKDESENPVVASKTRSTSKPRSVSTQLRKIDNEMASASNKQRFLNTLSPGEKGALERRAALAGFFTKKSEESNPNIPKTIADFFRVKPKSNPRGNSYAMKKGGAVKKMANGGSVSASKRADGIAVKGKTRGKIC